MRITHTHTPITGFDANHSNNLKHGTPTMPSLFHYGTSRFLSFRFLFLFGCSLSQKDRDLTFIFAHVTVTTHRRKALHSLCSPCSHASLWPRSQRMCVITERLGCLRWLAHAARHGHVQGASTSRSSASQVKHFHIRNLELQIGDIFPEP